MVTSVSNMVKALFGNEDYQQMVELARVRAKRDYDPARGMSLDQFTRNRVHFELVDAIRAVRGRVEARPGVQQLLDPNAVLSGQPDPSELAAANEEHEWLREATAGLGGKLQLVLGNRARGVTCPEIARLLGVSVARVHQLLREAKHRVRFGRAGQKAPAVEAPTGPTVDELGEAPEVRPLVEVEREAIEGALRYTRGRVAEAARLLGTTRVTIHRRLDRWGKSARDYQHP